MFSFHPPTPSKLKDAESKNREVADQLETMKKDLEDSRSRSDKGNGLLALV